MKDLPFTEYWELLIAHGKKKVPTLANLMDGNPDKWTDTVQELRDLCEKHKIPSHREFDTIFANIGNALKS